MNCAAAGPFFLRRFALVLAAAALLNGCTVVHRLQCGAAPLPEERVKDIALAEMERRGRSRDTVKVKVGGDGCDYWALVTYVPAFPGGHATVMVDQHGALKEVVPGR